MGECKWCKDEVCVNAECPMRADYCPVPDTPNVCRHEDRDTETQKVQADKERLEIELQAMRNAANSYKSRVKTLEMDNAQLHSDIVNANQNFDHIKGLWEAEKEKVEKAKQKVINVCKELQAAKSEIERLSKFVTEERCREIAEEIIPPMIRQVRAEAIKEFASKLKSRILKDIDEQGLMPLPYTKKAYDTVMVFINNIVKEMTEGGNDT